MQTRIDGLLPYAAARADQRCWDAVKAFWNEIRITDDIGVATWEDLEPIEREVTDCRAKDPPDIGRAISLTYKAHLLIAGLNEL